jgi:hypothetical protein
MSLLHKRLREDELETHIHKKQAVPMKLNLDFEDCLKEMLELLKDHDAFLTTWLEDEPVTQDVDAAYLQFSWTAFGGSLVSSTSRPYVNAQVMPRYRSLVDKFIREGALLHKSQLALKVRIGALYVLSSQFVGPSIPIMPQALRLLSPTLHNLLGDLRAETRLAAERIYAEQQGPGVGALRQWSAFENDVQANRTIVAAMSEQIPIPPSLQLKAALVLASLQMMRRHQEAIMQVVNEIHELTDVAAQTDNITRDTYTRDVNTELSITGRVGHAVTLPIKLEYVRITRSMTRNQ